MCNREQYLNCDLLNVYSGTQFKMHPAISELYVYMQKLQSAIHLRTRHDDVTALCLPLQVHYK